MTRRGLLLALGAAPLAALVPKAAVKPLGLSTWPPRDSPRLRLRARLSGASGCRDGPGQRKLPCGDVSNDHRHPLGRRVPDNERRPQNNGNDVPGLDMIIPRRGVFAWLFGPLLAAPVLAAVSESAPPPNLAGTRSHEGGILGRQSLVLTVEADQALEDIRRMTTAVQALNAALLTTQEEMRKATVAFQEFNAAKIDPDFQHINIHATPSPYLDHPRNRLSSTEGVPGRPPAERSFLRLETPKPPTL